MSKSRRRQPSPEAQHEIIDLLLKINNRIIAERVWTRQLTSAEQKKLGRSFEEAYERHKSSVSFWVAARGVSRNRAIVEIAYANNLLFATDRDWLLRELGEPVAGGDGKPSELPSWDAATRELTYRGKVVRTVRSMRTTNIERILDAFEEQGWPRAIDSPGWDQKETHDNVRSLNRNLTGIRFHASNSGQKVYWGKHNSR